MVFSFEKPEDIVKLLEEEGEIINLFRYFGRIEARKIALLNQIKSTTDPNLKEQFEEELENLCTHAQEIETHLLKLTRKERKALIGNIKELKKRLKNLKSKPQIPQKPPQQFKRAA